MSRSGNLYMDELEKAQTLNEELIEVVKILLSEMADEYHGVTMEPTDGEIKARAALKKAGVE